MSECSVSKRFGCSFLLFHLQHITLPQRHHNPNLKRLELTLVLSTGRSLRSRVVSSRKGDRRYPPQAGGRRGRCGVQGPTGQAASPPPRLLLHVELPQRGRSARGWSLNIVVPNGQTTCVSVCLYDLRSTARGAAHSGLVICLV